MVDKKVDVRGKKVIVVHPTARGGIAFDIYCPREEVPPELEGFGYRAEWCPVVNKLGTEGYVCSEDLHHDPEENRMILRVIAQLIRKGFDVEYVGLEEEVR
jgi:hypothetical protein